MAVVHAVQVEVEGGPLRVLTGGPEADAEPLVFLHGGLPGISLYCGGAHLWGPCLPLFAAERRVIAPDLSGAGDTAALPDGKDGVEEIGRFVLRLIESLGLQGCRLIGADQGGLVALWMALEAPQMVRAVTVVASATAAPSGDRPVNLALANPPQPRWSRESQAWAIERLSYTPHHIDAALLERCVACAKSAAHQAAVERNAGGARLRAWLESVAAAKGRVYAACRDGAFPVPVQVIWGTHDPLVTAEQGMVLFRTLAERQPAAHFHMVNRAGHFLYREEPAVFHRLVSAFHEA